MRGGAPRSGAPPLIDFTMITYTEKQKRTELYTKALGHITRLKILRFIAHEYKTVNEIAKAMGISHSVCSAHLGILWRTGLVVKRRVKNYSYYKLNPEKLEDIQESIKSFILGSHQD